MISSLLVIHLFNLIISGVQTSATNANFSRVVLRSENGTFLVASFCNVLGLAKEVRVGYVHFSARQSRGSDRINRQLRHSIIIKYDLFIVNLSLQAADFSFTLPSLPLKLLDILFVLSAFQVEYLPVEVLREWRSWSPFSIKSWLSEGRLDYHLIMAHPPPMDWIPKQRGVAAILIQLILHSLSLDR